jgi:DNA-binding transcriptional ArsR family regulator
MTTTMSREHVVNSHPHRRAIAAWLIEHGGGSPVEISRDTGIRLGTVAYHIRTLHKARVISLVDERRVRGAVEHRYELNAGQNIACEICGLPQERDGLCPGHREEWIRWAARRPDYQNDAGLAAWISERRLDIYGEDEHVQ